ncbi:2-aminoethylphosphonate--pyruvate transaminase [Paenibacillus caseinilyticus]|nr:2-aminoethylphosphonate--pyruvate transaminase [Paenibacillus mucilaginosus]
MMRAGNPGGAVRLPGGEADLPEAPYLLLTPGPLTTTKTVKASMLRDWCTWDRDYNGLVQSVRERLVELAAPGGAREFTAVLMQGSGTFAVESAVGTFLPREGGKLAVLCNGAYGERIARIAEVLGIELALLRSEETEPADAEALARLLEADPAITHVAAVHCETTTGMLNPVRDIAAAAKRYGRTVIIDAMSSFGGIPLDMRELGIDVLVSSSNKCIQGVPGFGFVIARRGLLAGCRGHARSHALDLFDQWETMERHGGKWRFTSPTHVVRAFDQALQELEAEGGPAARHARYLESHRTLVDGMEALGFLPLLPEALRSPFITTFRYPASDGFDFDEWYLRLKAAGFVIYPGKLSSADTFRIGTIGEVYPEDMRRLTEAVKRSRFWLEAGASEEDVPEHSPVR